MSYLYVGSMKSHLYAYWMKSLFDEKPFLMKSHHTETATEAAAAAAAIRAEAATTAAAVDITGAALN